MTPGRIAPLRAGVAARSCWAVLAAQWARLAGTCWLAACTTVTMDIAPTANFPAPLTETQRVTVGLYWDPAQRDFVHSSTETRHYHWRLKIGAAQTALFEAVATGMFAEVVALGDETRCARCDVILAPTLQEAQLSTPKSGPNRLYEVWLRYRIAVLSPDGSKTLHQSSFDAYGKAPERMKRQRGMRTALQRALRDAGALLVSRWAGAADVARRLAPER